MGRPVDFLLLLLLLLLFLLLPDADTLLPILILILILILIQLQRYVSKIKKQIAALDKMFHLGGKVESTDWNIDFLCEEVYEMKKRLQSRGDKVEATLCKLSKDRYVSIV